MEESTRQRIGEYVEMLEHIQKAHKTDMQTTWLIMQEVAKDLRTRQMNAKRQVSAEGPATQKQLEYLYNLGIEVPRGLTRQKASALLDAALEQPKVTVEKVR